MLIEGKNGSGALMKVEGCVRIRDARGGSACKSRGEFAHHKSGGEVHQGVTERYIMALTKWYIRGGGQSGTSWGGRRDVS